MQNLTSNHPAADAVTQTAQRAAGAADQALGSTKRAVNDTLESLQDSVSRASQTVPQALGSRAAQVEDLAHRGIEKVRDIGLGARAQVDQAGQRTVGYIKDEPVKAVLIAAATGVLAALLMRALSSRERY